MGGFNSGRQGGKRTTNKMTGLDIRKVHRAGKLVPGETCTYRAWALPVHAPPPAPLGIGLAARLRTSAPTVYRSS